MVGSDFHREYTAFGTEVSHAGRLLDRATEGQVVSSARFEALVRGEFGALLVDEEPDGGGVFLLSPADPRSAGGASAPGPGA
jgi:class 3 adenylate cyclase